MYRKIDLLTTHKRFADHLAPVWLALPGAARGRWLTEMAHADLAANLDRPILCSCAIEAHYARQAGRCVVYQEHSVGQAYGGRFLGWAPHHEAPDLFLAPGPYAARVAARMWPGTPVVQVGCPRLDPWHGQPARHAAGTVAVSFRFRGDLPADIPECGGALDHFAGALPALAREFCVLGHGHPRAMAELTPLYRRHGIAVVPGFADVLGRADLLVVDNSSVAYEFASLARPVLLLDSPRYRREVEHGLRFWTHLPGLECDDPADLPAAIRLALSDPPEARRRRAAAVTEAYVACDDRATERAVAALLAFAQDAPGHR